MRIVIILTCLLFPLITQAAVTISEIAWMGTNTSANDEWIELYNDGAATSLDGWVLRDSSAIEIALTGTIGAGAYATLERTDDTSAPGTALIIYTGALSNSGTTLTLYNAQGAVVDQVAGGENWENIGGDNTTKETAQYSSSGWVTALATPGAANATVGSTEDSEEEVVEEEEVKPTAVEKAATASRSKNEDVTSLYLIPRELQLTLNAPTQAYVNQAVTFSITPSGLSKGILQSLSYRWNFGDASVGSGESTTHRFAYPGQYVVTVHASYGDYEAELRQVVTVLPTTLSLGLSPSGEIQLHNDARYEIDISGYQVGKVVFPKRSMIVAGGTITLPHALKPGLLPQHIKVHDETNRLVTAYIQSPIIQPATMSSVTQVAAVSAPQAINHVVSASAAGGGSQVSAKPVSPSAATSDFNFANTEDVQLLTQQTTESEVLTQSTNEEKTLINADDEAEEQNSSAGTSWGYIGLAVLLSLALGGVYIRQA